MRHQLRIGIVALAVVMAVVMVSTACSVFDGDANAGPTETVVPSGDAYDPDRLEDIHDPEASAARRSCEGVAAPPTVPDQKTPDQGQETNQDQATATEERMVIFATCSGENEAPVPLSRPVERGDLVEILAGLTDGLTDSERDAGLFSWFDGPTPVTATADVDGDGVALIRFEQNGSAWQPDASTSSQTLSLVDPIAATVFANTDVTGIDRSGLCFGELDCNGVLLRSEFDQTMFLNHGVIASTACGLVGYWDRPTSCDTAAIHAQGGLVDAVVTNVADDDVLNMRANASAEAFIIGTLPNGTSVDAAEATASSPDGGSWQLIFDRSGTPGWVNTAFLNFEAEEPRPVGTVDHQAIAAGFISFARSLSEEDDAGAKAIAALDAVPFAGRVSLGLGESLIVTEDREDLATLDRWTVDVDLFRAYVGPFSIVEPLRTGAEFKTTVGPHDHCVSPPTPTPDGLEDTTIISIQPAQDAIDSCLRWFAVDLFVDDSDEIVAVTFDTWEP